MLYIVCPLAHIFFMCTPLSMILAMGLVLEDNSPLHILYLAHTNTLLIYIPPAYVFFIHVHTYISVCASCIVVFVATVQLCFFKYPALRLLTNSRNCTQLELPTRFSHKPLPTSLASTTIYSTSNSYAFNFECSLVLLHS